MRKMDGRSTRLALVLLAGATWVGISQAQQYDPGPGNTISLIGQTFQQEYLDYISGTGLTPAGSSHYATFFLGRIEQGDDDPDSRFLDFVIDNNLGEYALVALSIKDNTVAGGFGQMVDNTGAGFNPNAIWDALQAILSGQWDSEIDAFANLIANRPNTRFFLRIGYEVSIMLFANQSQRYVIDIVNGYANDGINAFENADTIPEWDLSAYPAAFNYIADRIRNVNGVTNVDFVYHPVRGFWDAFWIYPGAQFVDWVALSVFNNDVCLPVGGTTNCQGQSVDPNLQQVMDWASGLGHPLMFAEASVQVPAGNSANGFIDYLNRLHNLVVANDVRVLAYINSNWPIYGWDPSIWTDSRLEANGSTVLNSYLGTFGNGTRYLHGGAAPPPPPPPPGGCNVVYSADFELGDDGGWTNHPAGDCSTGDFVVGTPSAESDSGVTTQVGGAAQGSGAWFTATNTTAGSNDVDGGTCDSRSPSVTVGAGQVTVHLSYFHGQRDTGDDDADGFVIDVMDGGAVIDTLVNLGDTRRNAAWTTASTTFNVSGDTDLRLRVRATDGTGGGDLIEGGLDRVEICANDPGGPPPPPPPPPGGCGNVLYSARFESGNDGWGNASAKTCATGDFVVGTPNQQSASGVITQVGGAAGGAGAWFTATNTSAGSNDVDGGTCDSRSPSVTAGAGQVTVNFDYFHGQRDAGDDAADGFIVDVIDGNGAVIDTAVHLGDTTRNAAWTAGSTTFNVSGNTALRLRVRATDGVNGGDLIEGGLDNVEICGNDPSGPPPPPPPPTTGSLAKYEPINGQTLLILGQDLQSVSGYQNSGLFPTVGGVTTYLAFYDLLNAGAGFGALGQDTSGTPVSFDVDWGGGPLHAHNAAFGFPNSTLQIGLNLAEGNNGNLWCGGCFTQLANGQRDAEILRLAQFLNGLGNIPVYLRVGYEFDGLWNDGYANTGTYIAAYRRVVDILRQQGVDNVAYVWQSSASPIDDIIEGTFENIANWYPGDEYVDWVGISWFLRPDEQPGVPGNPATQRQLADDVLDFARGRGKPVMIAEATPQGYNLSTRQNSHISPVWDGASGSGTVNMSATTIWNRWFQPFFDYIHANGDVIKAVSYINANWDVQGLWDPPYEQGFWGDTRVEVDGTITTNWQNEIQTSFWLHGGPGLFGQLNP